MSETTFDLLVIGAGPGGYVAAIRAAQLGLRTAIVEREARLGGTCLRVGCIPSKALLESSERYVEAQSSLGAHGIGVGQITLDLARMMARKEAIVDGLSRGVAGLIERSGVTRFRGHARLLGEGRVQVEEEGGASVMEARHVLLATGSRPAVLPGVELDGDRVGASTEALSWPEPPAHLVVIGAGYIGLELGSVWRRLGSRVTVLEYLDHVLPGMDREIASEAQRLLRRQGLEFRLGTRVTGARAEGRTCVVEAEGMEPLQADRVLLAVGRTPVSDGLGLEEAGIKTDRRGFIRVDERFATSAHGVFAIGDVIGGLMLAHKAEEEGVACVERIATGYGHVDPLVIPAVVFTHPEIASVGRTEESLQEDGTPYRKGAFHFRGNARARALDAIDGRVKVLAHAETDRVLGVHIIGPRAGDLIAEAAAAMSFGASSEDLARTCHAHPTLPEALKEAALAVSGRAIHG